jgi:hypothetical protein
MFCSICGADSQSPNAYCKRCGEWLPDIKARTRAAFGGKTPQQNIFTGLFMSALARAVFSNRSLRDLSWRRRREMVCLCGRSFLPLHRRVAGVKFCR